MSLADGILRVDPASASLRAISSQLSAAADQFAAGRTGAAADLERAALAIAAEIRAIAPAAPVANGRADARLSGALADALRGKGSR